MKHRPMLAGAVAAAALALVMTAPLAEAGGRYGGGTTGMHAALAAPAHGSSAPRGNPGHTGSHDMNFKGRHDQDHHGHHHHHRAFFFGLAGPYAYDAYAAGGCGYYRHKARVTGLPYWWRRYQQCLDS